MKRIAIAILAVTNLWLSLRLMERRSEEERWRRVAVSCVDTATAASDVLDRCMVQLAARRRCVCFEEPASFSSGAQP